MMNDDNDIPILISNLKDNGSSFGGNTELFHSVTLNQAALGALRCSR